MNIKEVLKLIIETTLPFIKKLIESKVVPTLKRKAYQRLDDFTNDRIEDLGVLAQKIKSEENDIKRQAHINGFRLGLETLRAISDKINQACNELEKVV